MGVLMMRALLFGVYARTSEPGNSRTEIYDLPLGEFLGMKRASHSPQSVRSNSPKLPKAARKAMILHTLRVQVPKHKVSTQSTIPNTEAIDILYIYIYISI